MTEAEWLDFDRFEEADLSCGNLRTFAPGSGGSCRNQESEGAEGSGQGAQDHRRIRHATTASAGVRIKILNRDRAKV